MAEFFESVTEFFGKIGQFFGFVKRILSFFISLFGYISNIIQGIINICMTLLESNPAFGMIFWMALGGVMIIIVLAVWEAIS